MKHYDQDKIPNNVNLSEDKRLQRALERWQPAYLDWWRDMGPAGFDKHHLVYLRTAIGADSKGWAHFEHVKMLDYRWGIFLTEAEKDRKIGFGDFYGHDVWQELPGEYRAPLRRLIVTQGDTEPASVEQQRMLGQLCPSLYDVRNLFQVNVEEGRHLWAMVYLLHSFFGQDGRDEAEELLDRRSGNDDKPRILGAFNEPVTNWLDFFAFTMFIDRDGKYQLLALSESAFDPLSRTTRFMLKEEAHHMFVGETGLSRIVDRTCQLLKEQNGVAEDVRGPGGIDLETIQKTINLWFSLALDLFGSEVSSNAATYFANGLKGRVHEERFEDHVGVEDLYRMERFEMNGGGTPQIVTDEVPIRNAMNEVLRDDYISDCQRSVNRWNKILESHGFSDRITLPSKRFHRDQGIYRDGLYDPEGRPIDEETWNRRRDEWLPSETDRAFIASLQGQPIFHPDEMAHWITAPKRGINGQPVNWHYVRVEE